MPRPWTTRIASRKGTVWAKPAATEPATKIKIDTWTSRFLSNRSASLPQIGVDTVVASRAAVITQVYCRWVPARSPMIVGRATETIVEDSMAVNSAASRPVIASRICLWFIGAGSAARRGRTVADTSISCDICGGDRRQHHCLLHATISG